MALDSFSRTSNTALEPNAQRAGFMPANTLSDPYGFNSTINTSRSFQTLATGVPNLEVITPNPEIVKNRMVFSTFKGQSRPAKTLILSNTGSESLTITGLTFGGSQEKDKAVPGRLVDHERSVDFKFANTVKLPITLAPGKSINLPVQFLPKRIASLTLNDSPTHTLNGENYASLTITSNDPDGATKVNLAGLNSTYVGSDSEAALAEIVRSFGWTTDIGSEDNKLGVSNTLFGDEVYSPYWVRADARKPVELWPIAVYSSPSDDLHDAVTFKAKAGTGGRSGFIYSLAGRLQDDNVPGSNNLSGGENQKLLPKIYANRINTAPTSSTVDFNPNSPFALMRGPGSTDDSQNGPAKTRAWRIYPLLDANGARVSNTWIATTDIGTNKGRNGDFNDVVYVFKNVRPESRTLNSSAGFTSIQSSQRSLFGINPTADTLKVTHTVGINSDNKLVNGLQTTFGSRVSKANILTKLLGSDTNLNPGFRQAGGMLNSNKNNYMKLVAQPMPDGSLGIKFSAKAINSWKSHLADVTAPNSLSNFWTGFKEISKQAHSVV